MLKYLRDNWTQSDNSWVIYQGENNGRRII